MTLAEMLDGLRVEARISQNVAHGANLNDPHRYLLNRVQSDLYLNYDWPGLKATWPVNLDAGQRYVAYPENIEFEGIERLVSDRGGNQWKPMEYGIGPEQYNITNSDNDERNFPVCRWQDYTPPTGENNNNMFEVWPLPSQDTQLLVQGKRACKLLVNSTDKSTLDGYVVVLHAAAELLAANKAEDAALKLQKAQERMRVLKMRQTGPDNRKLSMSGGGSRDHLRPGIDYIPRSQ